MTIQQQLAALGASPEMIAGALCNGKPIADFDALADGVGRSNINRRMDLPDSILIVVGGPAQAKPRMVRGDKWKKRPAVVRYREWADLVRSVAGEVPAAEQVERITIEAFYEPPASWSKRKRCAAIGELHRQRVDADNIAKACLDTLWPDNDSAIASVSVRKRWDWNARIEIEIVLEGK